MACELDNAERFIINVRMCDGNLSEPIDPKKPETVVVSVSCWRNGTEVSCTETTFSCTNHKLTKISQIQIFPDSADKVEPRE